MRRTALHIRPIAPAVASRHRADGAPAVRALIFEVLVSRLCFRSFLSCPWNARRTLRLACIPLLLLGSAVPALAVPPGTPINNTAQAVYQIQGAAMTLASNTVTLTTTWPRSAARIELLQYAPAAASAETVQVPATQYSPDGTTSGTAQSIAAIHPAGSTTAIDLSQPVALAPASLYHQGEPIFFRVADADQNIEPLLAETIWVLLSSDLNDTELLMLTETAPSSGIFIGYLQSSGLGPVLPNNGLLDVSEGTYVRAQYTDGTDPADSVRVSVMVDPYGLVFDSATGQLVDGVAVTLIDATSGQPAVVFGDDGVSAFPSAITSGGTFTDASGKVYAFPRGGFRFPFVAPGQYRLAVQPPAGYAAPSSIPTAQLQALPGGPFAMAEPGSRGEGFLLNPGPALRIDIPVDPTANGLWVQKHASQPIAAVGDFVQYSVSIQNSATLPADGVMLRDQLPPGFRYRAGSVRLDGQTGAEPAISSDGRGLSFDVGPLPGGQSLQLRYVTEIGAGARPGEARNSAQAISANGLSSNTATALVRIKEDLFRNQSFITGRVIAGNCADAPRETADGVPGVRIYLENGTYGITDKEGKYHFEGVAPGTHVVQLDLASLPLTYEIAACGANARAAGTPYSRFVDLQGGTLWREDFHVQSRPAPTGAAGLKLACGLEDKRAAYQARIDVSQVALDNVRLTVVLPEGSAYAPGTSRLGGQPTADPETMQQVLVYRLGAIAAGENRELAFQVELNGALKPGRLHTKAMLSFDTPSDRHQRSEAIDTILDLAERQIRETQATIVVRPLFETYSDRLLPAGKALLDELAARLQHLEIEQASVVGHTDNLPVRSLSNGRFADNQVLSEARARQVSEYLAAKLHLRSQPWSVGGKGDSEPLMSNATEAGRAYNRRVEVTVMTVKVKVAQDIAAIKCEDQNSTATQGAKISLPHPAAEMVDDRPPAQDFSQIQIETLAPGFGWLMPEVDFNPAIPSLKVAVQHAPAESVELRINGRPATALTFEGRQVNKAGTVAVSLWRGLDLTDGGNQLIAVRKDHTGQEMERIQRGVYYAGFPVRAVLDKAASYLVANGTATPVVAVRLTDAQGRPARPGLSGSFSVEAPFEAQDAMDELQRALPRLNGQQAHYTIGADGIARIRLKPTSHSGQAVIRLQLETGEEEIRAWLHAEAREWILVGLAEGTAGYQTVSAKMEPLDASAAQEDFYQDGRLAFFAKGRIKGRWLLTAAMDSTKDHRDPDNPLFQTIDPGTYYTLYGDAAQQQHEAASIRKLYLKIEHEQFYALFGDYDTGLTVTELSRYSRRFNGIKSEYAGDRFAYNAFATDRGQAYGRDEIQGQGISGLYHLSRSDITVNSDKIFIQTRDRFRSDVILSTQNMTRFVDYSIDYAAGTLFFKTPIYSRDENFNPIFIVAEYESGDATAEEYTYGGRGAVKLLEERLEVGASAIHEGPANAASELGGLDARLDLAKGLSLNAETAATRSQTMGSEEKGQAYLAELRKTSGHIDATLYYRELESGFGLGQQNGSEDQTRKYGAEAAWRLNKEWTANGELYRSDQLATGAQRGFAESDVVYRDLRNSLRLGGRMVQDQFNDGTQNRSTQLLAGASRTYLEDRLQLRVTREQSLGGEDGSVDFPTRTLLGADYKLSKVTTVFAEHEITQGQELDSQSSRAGLKATPWTGGQIGSSLGRQSATDGQRLFANLGLFQSWQINPRWTMDGGLDRSQTVHSEGYRAFNPNVPTAAGAAEDFSATTLGLGYQADFWSWTGRLESRWAESEDKLGLITGIAGEVKQGLGLSAGFKAFDTQSRVGSDTLDSDLRLSLAWRPRNTRWIVYDRLDYLLQEEEAMDGARAARRIVNNFNANYKPYHRLQIAWQYGAKYAFDTIDGGSYSGYTDLPGLEARYDLTQRWDVGVHTSLLHSWQAGQMDERAGLSVGYNLFKNAWISLGYNFTGFWDEDFSAADYTAQGPFVKFRLKFDQQSVREMVDWFSRK